MRNRTSANIPDPINTMVKTKSSARKASERYAKTKPKTKSQLAWAKRRKQRDAELAREQKKAQRKATKQRKQDRRDRAAEAKAGKVPSGPKPTSAPTAKTQKKAARVIGNR